MHKALSFNVLYVQCKSETTRLLEDRNIFNYDSLKPNIFKHKQIFRKIGKTIKKGDFDYFLSK